ncbi:citrate-binding protein-like [Camellia sinensis]|uniref:citrate-binding protein-like n=1 Tax=Camellia sinensis TaxID=4442 RepID=UPI001036F0B1|nr:citrate-binding protein-like [Camellia sinensis]
MEKSSQSCWRRSLQDLAGAPPPKNPTDGFTNIPLTESNFKLQKPYDIPLEQHYSFQNGVHCLWVYADDKPYDPSSPSQPRTEIRILEPLPIRKPNKRSLEGFADIGGLRGIYKCSLKEG